MEAAVLLALLFLLFLGLGSLLGLVAFVRLREAQRRLARVETELRALRTTASPSVARAPAAALATEPVAMPERVHAPAPPPIATTPLAVPAPPPPPIPAAPRPQPSKDAAAGESLGWGSQPVGTAPLSTPQRAAKPARAPFDLERWLGVRGAAVLGGVFLIIAGFLFLQYSIERSWVTPRVRLIVGAVTGLCCLLAAVRLRRRGYDVLGNSLAGVGVVLWYAVAWAAHRVYGEIEFLTAFAAMVGVTGLCAWLAYRHSSQLVAVLGFVGGFATPLALSTGQDRPLGLFGYALLLDLAFLFVAHKRRWPSIALLGLVGTAVLQALWIFWRMGPDGLPLALGVVAAFGLLFAGFTALQPQGERTRWIPTQVGALLLPFAFVAYFAQHVELGSRLAPLAAIAAVMAIGAGILGRLQGSSWLSMGTAAGSLALVFVWIGAGVPDQSQARDWELALCSVGLALVQHVFAEWEARRRSTPPGAAQAASILTVGLLTACAAVATLSVSTNLLWPWVIAFAVLPLLAMRQAALGAHFLLACAAALLAGVGLAGWSLANEWRETNLRPATLFTVLFALGLVFLAAASLRRSAGRARAFWAVAAYLVGALLAAAHAEPRSLGAGGHELSATFALGLLLALAANGARSSLLLALAVAATLFAQIHGGSARMHSDLWTGGWNRVFWSTCLGAALFTIWPFLRTAASRARPGMWRVAACSSLCWFGLIATWVTARHGPGLNFATPLAHAVVLGILAVWLWRKSRRPRAEGELATPETETLDTARAWYGAIALLYASAVVPLQVDIQSFAMTAVLFGLSLAWLRTRLHRPGLAQLSAGCIALSMAALVADFLPDTFARAPLRIWNWHAYFFLLPAACAGLAAWLLRTVKSSLHNAVPAMTAGICGVVLGFAWLNLEVSDAFSHGETFRITLRGAPRANLALSIAWALYALALLGAGVLRGIGALRWASLLLLVMTIAKVFLFDLGHLAGLYRVASMLGLAISLLLVSFLYQRFVFRRPPPETPAVASG